MYVCLYQKNVCKVYRTEGVYCIGIYNTYKSWYLYILVKYICLLLIVYLKISLIYM